MNITDFFEQPSDDFFLSKENFFNGSINVWDEMPFFEIHSHKKYTHDCITIEFETIEEAKECSNFLGFDIDWEINKWPNIGKWFPPKDIRRNSKLRFMHKQTALKNPDLYEIIPLTEIKP